MRGRFSLIEVYAFHIKRVITRIELGCYLARSAASGWSQISESNTSSPPGQNGRHSQLGDDIFKWIFLNGNDRIRIQISPKFVPGGPIDNNPELVQIMTWRRIGDTPLSEAMLTQLTDAYVRH